ncbi:stromal interaction molecule 2-like [Girardinichthys multiradiatus]|uniref:stromal interaction molecule 2-like n=1 Tax=Girardinichthys multiradiatus TaxID=208333 RepID=UPI001FACBE26|nr:stromal interaction molecule 2-like [Girardinichthys multiradiatus]
MFVISVVFVVFPAALFVAAQSVGELQGLTSSGGSTGFDPPDPCMTIFPPCLSEADRYSLEALRSIHQMMDDDQDGGIEVEESMEFIIEDMKQQQTHKHSKLHREDQHITVEELWRGWKSSEVHNWTLDDVLRWLKDFVELPQYERNFKDFKVNGNTLPRIAANEPSFLSAQLKVLDQRDKQKLSIKALDVVLFGPPTRPPHNYMKDLLLIVSVVMGVGGCWFAQAQNKASKVHVAKMIKDLESLQRAEQSLMDLQEQLEQAQEEKRNVAVEKQYLEEKMRDEIIGAQEEAYRLHELRQGAVSELSRLRYAEEELEQVRGALKQAEKEMIASWTVSGALQQWLQLTHEVEVQYYNVKKHSAELQLAAAKEEAERIKKKRSSVLGTLHIAHSSSLDHIDRKIMEAKHALSDVTACLRERLHRWQHIEHLCGFPIMRNPGLANLTAQLYSDSAPLGFPRVSQSSCSCHSSVHGSIEDLLDEPAAPIARQMPGPIPPLKRSPHLRGSTICRAHRPGVIPQSQPAMNSPDPDLLIPTRASYSCYDDGGDLLRKTLKKQDSQEKFLDSEFITSPPLSKMFSSTTTLEASSRRFYHDEAELLADSEKVEAPAEFPVHKMSEEEDETPVDLDISCKRMVKHKISDPSLETFSFKISNQESRENPAQKKISRQRSDVSMDVALRKGISHDLDMEVLPTKTEKDTLEDSMDVPSRNLYKDRYDVDPLEMRKILRPELEASTETHRIILRDTMETSINGASRKKMRDDAECFIESRRITRNSIGMSQDIASRNLPLNTGDYQHESSLIVVSKDKISETAGIPQRKISRDELEYYTDTASIKMHPRETMDAFKDTSNFKDTPEFGLESSKSRGILRNEAEMSVGSVRRRLPGIPRSDTSLTDTFTENISRERMNAPTDMPKHLTLRNDFGGFESSSLQCRTGQPDLMPTSQVPWQSSSDLCTSGPLSQLVYDGILEKSCSSLSSVQTPLSASSPNLPQSKLPAELESPLPPPKVVYPSLASAPESGHDKNKAKDKSKKSLKLKNLFKKKNESTPEKSHSGLQKL